MCENNFTSGTRNIDNLILSGPVTGGDFLATTLILICFGLHGYISPSKHKFVFSRHKKVTIRYRNVNLVTEL